MPGAVVRLRSDGGSLEVQGKYLILKWWPETGSNRLTPAFSGPRSTTELSGLGDGGGFRDPAKCKAPERDNRGMTWAGSDPANLTGKSQRLS